MAPSVKTSSSLLFSAESARPASDATGFSLKYFLTLSTSVPLAMAASDGGAAAPSTLVLRCRQMSSAVVEAPGSRILTTRMLFVSAVTPKRRYASAICLSVSFSRGRGEAEERAYVERRTQRQDRLRVHVGRLEGAASMCQDGLVDGGEQVCARDHRRCVHEGVLECRIAGDELRLQKGGVVHVAEERRVHDVARRQVLDGHRLQHGGRRGRRGGGRHDLGAGKGEWQAWLVVRLSAGGEEKKSGWTIGSTV